MERHGRVDAQSRATWPPPLLVYCQPAREMFAQTLLPSRSIVVSVNRYSPKLGGKAAHGIAKTTANLSEADQPWLGHELCY